MKNFFLTLVIALSAASTAFADNIYFILNNGSVVSFPLNEVRRLTLGETQLDLLLTNNSVVSWNFDQINYYSYTQPVGIEDAAVKPLAQFDIFPNPVGGLLTLNYSLPAAGQYDLKVYNLNGTLVKEEKHLFDTKGEHKLDLSKLTAGQYILKINGMQLNYSKSFIKN